MHLNVTKGSTHTGVKKCETKTKVCCHSAGTACAPYTEVDRYIHTIKTLLILLTTSTTKPNKKEATRFSLGLMTGLCTGQESSSP